MEKNRSYVRKQIVSLFDLMPTYISELSERITSLLTEEEVSKYSKIFFIASGDSYSACLAGARIFETVASQYAHKFIPIKAIDYARYLDFSNEDTSKSLALVVSISGIGSRVVEVVDRSITVGVDTLLITNNSTSDVYQKATHKLFLEIPKFENNGPALRTYFVSLLALYLLAAKFSDPNEKKSSVKLMMNDIKDYVKSYETSFQHYDTLMQDLASKFRTAKSITVIGDKDEESSCLFAVSKVIELTGVHSRWDDSEEWGHINYFNKLSGIENPVFFFGNSGYANMSRLLETIEQANNVGKPTILLVDEDYLVDNVDNRSKVVLLPKYPRKVMQPLCSYIPLALFAHHLSVILGEEPFRGDLIKEQDNTIRNSKVVVFGVKPNEYV